jgi:transposase InsO family protein
MKAYRQLYPVKIMARVLEVSRSGYYAWLTREPSRREIRDSVLKVLIDSAHKRSRGTYGPRRLQDELAAENQQVGRDHISRLRKEMGLKCIQKKRFKITTDSKHHLPVAENLLDQKFSVSVPATVWGTDITYISTDEGWLYLAGVKDFASREILGYAMGSRMTTLLVQSALQKALRFRKPLPGCIHHSDRGSQYCAEEYRKDIEKAGMVASMSRKGNCYDNAPTESFWGHLKQELVHHRHFQTRNEAIAAIREYIEIFYNRMRRHSALGNMAPSVFAEIFYSQRRIA